MSTNVLRSVVDWIRRGYPQGIPATDFPPLLALLDRCLTPAEVDQVTQELMASHPGDTLGPEQVAQAIKTTTHQPPTTQSIRDVAARLAEAGWPLASLDESSWTVEPAHDAGARGVVGAVLDWLRAGYPQGVPQTDYIPVLALLGRRLTSQQADQIAHQLITSDHDGKLDPSRVAQLITHTTQSPATETDINRVQKRLAQAGWPLQSPPQSGFQTAPHSTATGTSATS